MENDIQTESPVQSDSSGSNSEVINNRSAIDNAKKAMFSKPDQQAKTKPERLGDEKLPSEKQNDMQNMDVSKDMSINVDEKPMLDTRKSHDKKQINKLVAQRYQLKEENARLMAEIENYKKKFSVAPQESDFASADEYNKAKIKHEIASELSHERISQAQADLEYKQNTDWTERCQQGVENFDRFTRIYQNNYDDLMSNEPELMSFAAQSDVGPRILELAFDEILASDKLRFEWRNETSENKKKILAEVERQIMAKKEIPQKSSAPAPIKPEKQDSMNINNGTSLREQIARSKRKMFG